MPRAALRKAARRQNVFSASARSFYAAACPRRAGVPFLERKGTKRTLLRFALHGFEIFAWFGAAKQGIAFGEFGNTP